MTIRRLDPLEGSQRAASLITLAGTVANDKKMLQQEAIGSSSPVLPEGKQFKQKLRCAIAAVPEDAFSGHQLCLFQDFLTNTHLKQLSNAVDLWDSIPRYSISRHRMNSMRTKDGFLDAIEIPFFYRQRQYVAIVYPARIRERTGSRISYYPSGREELIEHALRKIATEQNAGFFDRSNYQSGVRFSLHRLRKELEYHGHALRYDELVEGLSILSLSAIEIVFKGNGEEEFARSNYLPALSGVSRKDYDADREARWIAQFHPLVTRSIDQVTYRQFNYLRLMKCNTQLGRWLLSQIVLKYTQASLIVSFEMRFSTIRRDSALLEGYGRTRDGVVALDYAWKELIALGALQRMEKAERRGKHNKLDDVIYTINATREFMAEQKAANRRFADACHVRKTHNQGE